MSSTFCCIEATVEIFMVRYCRRRIRRFILIWIVDLLKLQTVLLYDAVTSISNTFKVNKTHVGFNKGREIPSWIIAICGFTVSIWLPSVCVRRTACLAKCTFRTAVSVCVCEINEPLLFVY